MDNRIQHFACGVRTTVRLLMQVSPRSAVARSPAYAWNAETGLSSVDDPLIKADCCKMKEAGTDAFSVQSLTGLYLPLEKRNPTHLICGGHECHHSRRCSTQRSCKAPERHGHREISGRFLLPVLNTVDMDQPKLLSAQCRFCLTGVVTGSYVRNTRGQRCYTCRTSTS